MMDYLMLGLVMVGLLLVKGFFSGSELALVSCDKLAMRSRAARGDRGAALVLRLFERPDALLATTLIGTNIATVGLSVIGASTILRITGPGGDIYAVLILTPIMLVLGEIVPKSVFQHHANSIAPLVSPVFAALRALLSPIVFILGWIGRRIAGAIAPERSVASPFAARQRLRMMLEEGGGAADAAVIDRDRIRRTVRLADMTVGEAMSPLGTVVGATVSSTTAQLIAVGKEAGRRSVPLYDGNLSNIVAIALWSIWDEASPDFAQRDAAEFHVTPHFASPLQRLDELLPVLLSRTDHMAVVVDEFGTAIGIVTVEDLMVILLGDVARDVRVGPKRATAPGDIRVEAEGSYILDAKSGLADVAELLEIEMPTREFHSVGGFLTSRLRRIPSAGDTVEAFGYRFTVTQATTRGPTQVRADLMAG
jgi:CBS domain containing-hemolysin-like protein